MKNACFNPPPELHGRVAATEVVDGKPLIGVVHDENARSMGGVSGNAGLFATAEDLARFALMLLGKGRLGERRVLSAAALREATRDHTGHLGESRGLGWVVKGLSPGHLRAIFSRPKALATPALPAHPSGSTLSGGFLPSCSPIACTPPGPTTRTSGCGPSFTTLSPRPPDHDRRAKI